MSTRGVTNPSMVSWQMVDDVLIVAKEIVVAPFVSAASLPELEDAARNHTIERNAHYNKTLTDGNREPFGSRAIS